MRRSAIPMWYRYRDGVITITTSSRSQKYKNVQRLGKAMVVIEYGAYTGAR